VLLTTMTLTPGAGDYLACFSTSLTHSATSAYIYCSLYVDGVQVAASERRIRVDNSGTIAVHSISIQYILAGVGAGQAVEIRWRTTAATATAYQRNLSLVRLN